MAATAELLAQIGDAWSIESDLASRILGWACLRHEIGLDISYNTFHKHGVYIAENADLPGFPRSEQELLSFLVAAQRSSIDKGRLSALPTAWHEKALRLAVVLRLAVLLNHSRKALDLPGVIARASEQSLMLYFTDGWLDDNPLTVADLRREQPMLAAADIELDFE